MIARRSSWIVAGGSVVAFVIAWILYPGVDASANALFFEVLVDIEVRDVAHLQNIIGALRVSAAVESVERVRDREHVQ